MADDKDEGSPDPWAGLKGPDEGDVNDAFAFSFDELKADTAAEDVAEINAEEAAVVEEVEAIEEQVIEGDPPILEAIGADTSGENDVEDDIAGWLEESSPKAEEFQPSGDRDSAASEDEHLEATEVTFADAFQDPDSSAPQREGLSFDALEGDGPEDTAEDDEGEEIVGFPVLSAATERDVEVEAEEATEAFSFEDATNDEADVKFAFDARGRDSGEADEAFVDLESDDGDREPAAVLAIGAATVTAATATTSKPKVKKKSGGGALGPILGGLMSLPIVFLVLLGMLWGTGRDPIGMRSWLPSFMLPARQGAVAAATDQPPSLDDLAAIEATVAQEGPPTDEPDMREPDNGSPPLPEVSPEPVALVSDPLSPPIESPPIGDPLQPAAPALPADLMPNPATAALPVPAEPASLDLLGIETAVDAALAAMDRVADASDSLPADRRRALVAWYKDLARVGTELAMLETVAADSGRPLDETPAAIATLYERLGNANDVAPDLKRLCRNWVDYAKRPADGVLLVGVLDAARQVGPFWYSTLSLEQVDGTMRPLSLISRREPRAEPGEQVAVAGVVFSEDTVWAADCGRLATTSADEEDPF
jgi:hypothetical protein